jgi:hypothetical protein
VFYSRGNLQWWEIVGPELSKPLPSNWLDVYGMAAVTLSGVPWSNVTSSNLSACGTSPNVKFESNDGDGLVTEGTSATGCTLTFQTPFTIAPVCTLSSPTGTLPTSYSTTTTALTIVNASGSNAEFVYHCRPTG